MTVAIAFFNNKGGVGKTTLACNYASYLAHNRSLRVAVADCDPQSNATQLLLGEQEWEYIYEDAEVAEEKTILRALREIRDGDSSIVPDFEIHHSTRFDVDVLAGHPSLSIVEDILSTSSTTLALGSTTCLSFFQ
jgi:cellulose biosynthesis protein BcsQ